MGGALKGIANVASGGVTGALSGHPTIPGTPLPLPFHKRQPMPQGPMGAPAGLGGLVSGIIKGMPVGMGPGLSERAKQILAKKGQQGPQEGMQGGATMQPALPNKQTAQRMNPPEVPTRRFERY